MVGDFFSQPSDQLLVVCGGLWLFKQKSADIGHRYPFAQAFFSTGSTKVLDLLIRFTSGKIGQESIAGGKRKECVEG